jgi:UPF0271 protein
MGLDPSGLDFESYSVPEVREELREQTGPSYRLAISSSSGKLRIQSPTSSSLEEVSEKASILGDRIVLSKADTNVLALALDLRREGKMPIIVSDDYAVQNVAEGIGIAFQPLATLGIREKFNWIYYCPACFRRYTATDVQVCAVCGTKLKRKPIQKQAAKRRHSKG